MKNEIISFILDNEPYGIEFDYILEIVKDKENQVKYVIKKDSKLITVLDFERILEDLIKTKQL